MIALVEFIDAHSKVFLLTGAGVSTASGIPDYRDASGQWKHPKPMEYREFIDLHSARQRYWARSAAAWQRFKQAQPNQAHHALARLELLGKLVCTLTQNVDGLHQRAGSRRVTELHGSIEKVVCLDCAKIQTRETMQRQLLEKNPALGNLVTTIAPDGDANIGGFDHSTVDIPYCDACGGILKPDVVFFGESVPSARVNLCFDTLRDADSMLIVGSSLMVYSGFRFARQAQQMKIPIAAINLGDTRADAFVTLKIAQECGLVLNEAVSQLDRSAAHQG